MLRKNVTSRKIILFSFFMKISTLLLRYFTPHRALHTSTHFKMYATTYVLRGNANTAHDGETQSLIGPRASPGRGFAKYVTPLRISVLLGLGTAAVLGVSTLSPDVLVGNLQIFSTPFSKDTFALGDPAAYDGGGVSGAVSEAGPVDTSADYESPSPAASPVDTSTEYESPSPAASPVDTSTDYESSSPAASPVEISADEESPSPAASPAASPIDTSADEIDNLKQKLTAFTKTFNAIKDLKNIKDLQHNYLIPNDIKDVITALSDPSDTEGLILTKEGTILDGVNGLQSVIQNEIDGDGDDNDDNDDDEGDDNGEYHGDANEKEEEEEEEQFDPKDPEYDEETIEDLNKSHGYGVPEKEDGEEETTGAAEEGDYSSGQTASKVTSETADDDEGNAYAEPQFPSETEENDDEETNDNDDSGRGGGRSRRQKRQEERRARLEDRKAKRSSRRERRGQ